MNALTSNRISNAFLSFLLLSNIWAWAEKYYNAYKISCDIFCRWDFNFAEFLGVKEEIRITTLASPDMFQQKLIDCFGENDQFTVEMGMAMKEKMQQKLIHNDKEEANSMVGLIMLFDQSGGHLTDEMSEIIEKVGSIIANQPSIPGLYLALIVLCTHEN